MKRIVPPINLPPSGTAGGAPGAVEIVASGSDEQVSILITVNHVLVVLE